MIPVKPPPLPFSARHPQAKWIALIMMVAALVVGVSLATMHLSKRVIRRMDPSRQIARQPVDWSTNTVTAADVQRQRGEFRLRQYLDAYRKHGDHGSPCAAESHQLIETWIKSNHGGPVDTNLPPLDILATRLAANPQCRDPIALIAAAAAAPELHERHRRFARALTAFEGTGYRAYPRFYAAVSLLEPPPGLQKGSEQEALQLFAEMFQDGGLTAEDQADLAESLIMGWGGTFFARNREDILKQSRQFEGKFPWLALVLKGEYHVKEAWKSRGQGYAHTVTPEGWHGFSRHLAEARTALTSAWELRPDLPLAPSRMVNVAMGDAGAGEMRLWFDRTLAAQIDHPNAWTQMRWGLRPRWHGSQEAMLALGKTALDTGRFDTDVPRRLFDVVSDLEQDLELPLGEHIYGRRDIWPLLRQMYEGYIASPAQAGSIDGWRSTYAVVAHLAGHDEVARRQLEALNWQPWRYNLTKWGLDLSLLPEQVAALTSTAGGDVRQAESAYQEGDLEKAADLFQRLSGRLSKDAQALGFIRHRLAVIGVEQRLQAGEWVSVLPGATNDLNWQLHCGEFLSAAPDELEIKCDRFGHLLWSRVRTGPNFVVRGEFEVLETSSGDFQAGLVFGLPDGDGELWHSFRIKRNGTEKDIASLGIAWTVNQTIRPAELQADRNAFEIRIFGRHFGAFVNGKELFRDVPLAQRVKVAGERQVLGLGAFNDMNETAIRYRKLELRRM